MIKKKILLVLLIGIMFLVSGCYSNRDRLIPDGKCKYDTAVKYCEDIGEIFIGGSPNGLFNTFTFDCMKDNVILEHKIKVFGCEDSCIEVKQADRIKVLK